MARFPLASESDASREVRDVYHDAQNKLGLPDVPNFFRTQGNSPAMLAGTWGLIEHLLLEGKLPRPIKELIFLAVAAERECSYCKEAHAACCRMLGIDDSTIEAVKAGLKGDLPEHIRDTLLFAIKCSSAPEELTDEDFARLAGHGLDREQLLEVVATSAMAVYATIIADATMLEPDAMFSES